MKCPSPNCNATRFKIETVDGKDYTVCEHGHAISRDNTRELYNLANALQQSIGGVATQIQHESAAIRKKLAEIQEVLPPVQS